MKDSIRSSVLNVVYCDDYFNIKTKYLATKTPGHKACLHRLRVAACATAIALAHAVGRARPAGRVHKVCDFVAFADWFLRPLREMYSLSFATTYYV
jgi:hypothetical protein